MSWKPCLSWDLCSYLFSNSSAKTSSSLVLLSILIESIRSFIPTWSKNPGFLFAFTCYTFSFFTGIRWMELSIEVLYDGCSLPETSIWVKRMSFSVLIGFIMYSVLISKATSSSWSISPSFFWTRSAYLRSSLSCFTWSYYLNPLVDTKNASLSSSSAKSSYVSGIGIGCAYLCSTWFFFFFLTVLRLRRPLARERELWAEEFELSSCSC